MSCGQEDLGYGPEASARSAFGDLTGDDRCLIGSRLGLSRSEYLCLGKKNDIGQGQLREFFQGCPRTGRRRKYSQVNVSIVKASP